MTFTDQLRQLTSKYNDAVRALDNSYTLESTQSSGWNLTSSYLKRQYSKRYDALAREYHAKRNELLTAYEQQHPGWSRARRMWGWTFFVGIVMAMVCRTAALPDEEEPQAAALSSAVSGDAAASEVTYWNADNIPIPYLQDSTQYVSNPDHVLTPQTVERMNVTLQKLNLELGIQSVTIVVNHIENDDPFRMAQDVGNRYGVGHGDRGLVVVVAYEDHAVTIAPGRSLEADLTDAECHRLQQRYVVPAMRQNMPDSAMIYLTEALYSTLQKKALPTMALSSHTADDTEDEMSFIIGLTFAFLVGWFIFFMRKNRHYQWIITGAGLTLIANPFFEVQHHSGGGFGGGGFGGFGGGGGSSFGGGSFGGGSFGGGGATSRW